MAYTKTTWVDRVVQYPNRYTKTSESTSSVTLTPDFGTVTAAGTPVNAAHLNKIEAGIESAIGIGALANFQYPNGNTALGEYAATNTTTGLHNCALGRFTLWANQTGEGNTAVGDSALYATTGSYNTALGTWAMEDNTTGSGNTAVGVNALINNTTGSTNTALGTMALYNAVATVNNTALGYASLQYRQDGSALTTFDNCTGVGYDARVSWANQVQLGNSATTTYAYGAVQNRSDARDKTDIRDTILGLDFIKVLRPVDFRWDYRDDYLKREEESIVRHTKDGSMKRTRYHHGLIAQDVKAVCDQLGIDFGGYQDHAIKGGDDVLSIGYTELIGPLIKAVQELALEVERLKGAKA